MYSSRLWGGKPVKKKKKKGENVETETQHSKRQPKHTLYKLIIIIRDEEF